MPKEARVAAVQAAVGCSKKEAEKAAVEVVVRETGHVAPKAQPKPVQEKTLGNGLTRITIEVTEEELALIKKLRENEAPWRDTKEMVMALVKKELKEREPKPKKANFRSESKTSNRRHIPASVKREVMARAGGQCEFVSDVTGRRCCAKHELEYDHKKPIAHGGDSTLDNLRVFCRNHNVNAAVETLGRAKMQEHIPGLRS